MHDIIFINCYDGMMDMTDKIKAKIIVTYGRSLIALNIAQSLGKRGVEIIGCDDVDMTVLSFSKFVKDNEIYTSPKKNAGQFIDDLLSIIKKHKPNDDRPYLLIPSFYEARLIAQHADKFKDNIIVAAPSFESINQVDPKDNLSKTLQNLDIESPKTWFPDSEDDLEDIYADCNYPVFIKPPDEVGGRGISKIDNDNDLHLAFCDLKEKYPDKQILIQEGAKGTDYCYCGLFNQGELIASMVYHNNQTFPNNTGPGVVRETVNHKKFDPLAGALMKYVQWNGVCEIDFMWTGDDKDTPMMIEVNPRFWSGLNHSVRSGMDFPHMLYQLFANGSVPDISHAEIGHKTKLPVMSELSAMESFINNSINFDKLRDNWDDIKGHLKGVQIDKAVSLFQDSIKGSISFDNAYQIFKTMTQEAKSAEKISVDQDDPFVGLGALFILGSLIRHGSLPPEVKR